MKTSLASISKVIFFLSFFSTPVFSQITLLSENFNNCTYPTGWALNVVGDGTPVYEVGLPTNANSNGSTIDGSCMLIIDDDAAGNNMPAYTLQIISSAFDGTQTPTVELNLDVHWRPVDGNTLKIKVYDGSEFHEVRSWGNGDGTGEEFSEFENVTLDLSFYASANMQLVIEYEDTGAWGWWAGVDNIEIVGKGTGTNVLLEPFNACSMPTGWTNQIQEGENEWQFGLVDNGNASVSSMNGSCFAYFDDDGLGQNAPFSSALLVSPVIDGTAFANFTLEFDLIFRKFAELEQFSVWVFDGTDAQLVQTFPEDTGGPQFDNYEHVTIDLSPYRSQNMNVIFSYFDGHAWGWWVGIDNVKVIGEGQINDLCSNAFDLSTGSDCISGNNLTAIFDGDQPACTDNNIAGLWYRYTADFTGILKINTQADFNDVITVYTGGCAASNEMTCTNRDEFGFIGESLYMDVVSGTEYMIRVSGLKETFGLPKGHLCISAEQVPAYPTTPVNDDCTNAISLQIGDACNNGNNLNANFTGPEPSLNLKSRADIWYSFEATTSEEIEVLSNADFADVITIYSGSCGVLTEVASNDFGQTLKTSGLTVGQIYFVQVAGFFATLEGNVCVNVQEVNPTIASNDLCGTATTLIIGGGCVYGENIAADFDGPSPSCAVESEANIWYQFVAPASGSVKLNTGADFVHTVAVYSGPCTDLEEFMCFNNPTRCDGYLEIGGLTEGETYFIQIASAQNTFGFMEGTLCVDLLDFNSTNDFEPLNLSVNVNCIEDGFGQIEIVTTGGVGAYTFQGNTALDTFATGDEYIVVVSDENNCETSRIGIIECGQVPCVLNTNLTVLNISCFGENNGQAFVEALDGEGPYTYQWSTGANTSLINGLSAGTYSVTVQDAVGCPAELSFEIIEPGFLLGNISSTGETDSDLNDGTAMVDPSGGTAPFTYVWSNGATTASISNLSPGIYDVTVTDVNGCESMESIVVSDFDCALSLEIVTQEISCNGVDDGYIEVYPQGGTAPFTFNWNTGATTDVLNNLGPGNYTVTITDANDCPWVENISFTEPPVLSVAAAELIAVDCNGNSTGAASVVGFGGTPPYSFAWSNGGSGAIQTGLLAGNYIVTITDDRGCNEVNVLEVLEPAILTAISINPQNVTCNGESDGIATVIVSGGTAPFTYLWDDPNNQVSSQAVGLDAGTYTVTVTDVNGCTSTEIENIDEPAPLILTVDATFDETNNQANGAIEITVVGGIAPYDFDWELEDGTNVSDEEDPDNLESGTYILELTDANGCIVFSETIVLDNLVGVSDPALEQLMELLPNPTSGKFQLNIELENSAAVSIMVTDVLGRVLIKTPEEHLLVKTFDFDLSEYPAAVYPIKIFVDDKVVLKQIIVQK